MSAYVAKASVLRPTNRPQHQAPATSSTIVKTSGASGPTYPTYDLTTPATTGSSMLLPIALLGAVAIGGYLFWKRRSAA